MGPIGQKTPPAVRVAELKSELAKDPQNTAKWVELGNIHYDMREREDAVNAYARALALSPNDVNVITDQGVMYRELGELDKALANFKRARELDPKHVTAAFNLGVMQAQLQQKDDAIKSLEAVVQLDPDGRAGEAARKLIESLKAPPPKSGAKAPAQKGEALQR
jgi:cytochrome c-type biogenesis protein CcmH/NrfG